MSRIAEWLKKAEDLARGHSKQADKVLDRAERFAKERTGHKYDQHIEKGVDEAQRRYGGGERCDDICHRARDETVGDHRTRQWHALAWPREWRRRSAEHRVREPCGLRRGACRDQIEDHPPKRLRAVRLRICARQRVDGRRQRHRNRPEEDQGGELADERQPHGRTRVGHQTRRVDQVAQTGNADHGEVINEVGGRVAGPGAEAEEMKSQCGREDDGKRHADLVDVRQHPAQGGKCRSVRAVLYK